MKYTLFTVIFLYTGLLHTQNFNTEMNHLALQVTDVEKSIVFYHKILGLDEMYDGTEQPHIRWMNLNNHTELHLIEDKNFKQTQVKGVHFAVRVADLDAFIQHLKTEKILFENWLGEKDATSTRPDGIRQVYIQDPDGHWIEVNGK